MLITGTKSRVIRLICKVEFYPNKLAKTRYYISEVCQIFEDRFWESSVVLISSRSIVLDLFCYYFAINWTLFYYLCLLFVNNLHFYTSLKLIQLWCKTAIFFALWKSCNYWTNLFYSSAAVGLTHFSLIS